MKKILVIEDNDDIRDNIVEILALAEYETAIAKNGLIGVQKALDYLPDLILCDIMMPEINGYNVLSRLKEDHSTSTIPFIFMTAKTESSDQRRGMEMGAVAYLTKPFDDKELLSAIELVLGK